MAREVGCAVPSIDGKSWCVSPSIEKLVSLVRADEREEFQRWFDAVTAQHKQEILAEREACAKFCETHQVWVGKGKRGFSEWGEEEFVTGGVHQGMDYAAAIRARSQA
jgi:hypothetical protein